MFCFSNFSSILITSKEIFRRGFVRQVRKTPQKDAFPLYGIIITRREKNVKYLLFMAKYAFGE